MGRHQILLCFLFLLRSSSLPFASRLCPPDQRDALLRLKDSFLLDRMASYYSCEDDASYPKTNSWNKSVDCCSWDGVTCDIVTGKVVGLDLACGWLHGALHSNSSLFLLGHLRSLNLFGNNFAGSSISPNLSAFAELTHLNLSTSHFSGSVPGEISRLSKLVSLDLSISDMSSYSYLRLENPVFTMLVQNLTALEKLVLDQVDMPMVSPKYFANFSSSLTYLSASGCSLGGILFPDIVLQLPSLTHLDISLNDYVSGILPQSNWTVPLEYLSLRLTNISGEIPDSIGSLSRLTVLDVSGCRLTGHIPSSTWNLKKLQALYLDRNYLSGVVEFENFAKFKDLRALTVSQELNLIYDAPKYTFPALEVLRLPSCNLTKFPYFLSSLKRLTDLDLSSNGISGEIPRWFWGVSQDTLEHLDLSSNLLEGGIPQLHWKRLSSISLENNSFQGPLPIPPPSTSFFDASRNGFTGEVPSSICLLSSLWMLDLSNNNLSGNMPSCFGNITDLQHLVLSNNKLQGPLMRSLVKFHGRNNPTVLGLSSPALRILSVSNNNFIGWWPVELFSNTSLVILDLSNNEFEGPIPLPSPVTFYYSTANNKLTGKIPSSICNATRLTIVDLSNNALTGSLPRCLTNFSTSLSVLNLRMNYLEGTIPLSFSSGNSLMTLDLSRNLIEGTLPRSLVECRNLEVLDLSDNQMKDTFPRWLGTLPELKVLVLRSNNLKDMLDIPLEAHLFPKLRILDLSNNNFSGPLPSNLITNLKGMMIGKNGQVKSLYMTRSFGRIPYENSVAVTMKGLKIELVKILTFLTIIDLSHNSFQGNIPEVIGHLQSLVGLNLSQNHLTGSIPPTLGNLTDLGWLDLSSNKLGGAIPRKLGDLASLGYLNLSRNQLTGRIPQDKQLSTFSSDSFNGNPSLCGTPLPKACPDDAQPPPPSSSSTFDREGHESWFEQKTVWLGYVSGFVIGISIAYIAFAMEKPKWLMRFVRMLERRAAEWTEKPKRKAIKFHGQ